MDFIEKSIEITEWVYAEINGERPLNSQKIDRETVDRIDAELKRISPLLRTLDINSDDVVSVLNDAYAYASRTNEDGNPTMGEIEKAMKARTRTPSQW